MQKLLDDLEPSRLDLKDTAQDVVAKLSEGNPGAMSVCMEIITQGKTIDPDDFMGGMSALLSLDSHGIYGTYIYLLHNDVCGSKSIFCIGNSSNELYGGRSDIKV